VELMRSLKQNRGFADIPVFVVSSLDEKDFSKFREAGAIDVLRKGDLTPELLGTFVRNLLRGRRPWPHVLGSTSSIVGECDAQGKNRIHGSATPAASMTNHVKETRQ
jgi:DNA-binding response OmpR family regulator